MVDDAPEPTGQELEIAAEVAGCGKLTVAHALARYRERLASICDAVAQRHAEIREQIEIDGSADRLARLEASESASEECAELVRAYGAPK